MDLLKVAVLSFVSFFELFLLTKLMGSKEMSNLSMFDYIISITIGSIAAEMATSLESNFLEPVVAMLIYAVLNIGISILNNKSLKIRRIISGNVLVLYDNGKLFRNNFKKAKLDINEFLMQCRTLGYFNLADIQTAILEANGKLSIIPISLKRAATPEDLNLSPSQERITVNVILDGKILKENLLFTGNDEIWLQKELVSQGYKDEKGIFLATCDSSNNLSVYLSDYIKESRDFFE